jgi:hypothetical protein
MKTMTAPSLHPLLHPFHSHKYLQNSIKLGEGAVNRLLWVQPSAHLPVDTTSLLQKRESPPRLRKERRVAQARAFAELWQTMHVGLASLSNEIPSARAHA